MLRGNPKVRIRVGQLLLGGCRATYSSEFCPKQLAAALPRAFGRVPWVRKGYASEQGEALVGGNGSTGTQNPGGSSGWVS